MIGVFVAGAVLWLVVCHVWGLGLAASLLGLVVICVAALLFVPS